MPHLRGVPQPVQVAHLQLGVGQGYRLVKQLDSTLQVAALNLNIEGLRIRLSRLYCCLRSRPINLNVGR